MEQEFYFAVARITAEKAIQELEVVTPSDISGAIRGGSSLISLIKEITEIAKKAGNAELIRAIADLNLEVAEGNLKLADLTNQLAALKQENTELKQKVSDLEKQEPLGLEYRAGLYYRAGEGDPYCPNCYENKKITMLSMIGVGNIRNYKCQTCKWSQSKV